MIMAESFVYCPPVSPLNVLYEDDDFIVVDKTAGLLSVPGRLPQHQDSAYLRILKQYPQAKVTHRLDMATSGILLFAKHRDAEVAMSKIFQARTVKKQYIALVDGKAPMQTHIDVPLITDWPNRPKQKVDFEEGKKAQTNLSLLEFDSQLNISRVSLEPITGRSHQLRVHLMHIGHPIMGDQLYHPHPQKFSLDRMALHANQLEFTHPFLKTSLVIQSKLPF